MKFIVKCLIFILYFNNMFYLQQGDCDSYNQLVGVMHHSKGLAPDEVALLVVGPLPLFRYAFI